MLDIDVVPRISQVFGDEPAVAMMGALLAAE
jgi:hypothetical protein